MKQLIKEFLNSKFTITQFCKDKNINIQKFKEELKAKGYIIQKSATPNIIRYLHLVIKDYKSGKYSIAQLSKKYNIAPSTISNNLKKLNIKIIGRSKKQKLVLKVGSEKQNLSTINTIGKINNLLITQTVSSLIEEKDYFIDTSL